ncbi:MAG: glycoside hydrolase family 55 protein [Oscillospiraceae bacterium]|jgi:hypothetical protein|nr:glycoside hydrolase family 55 protein [Oscillospiraceae bacterium]
MEYGKSIFPALPKDPAAYVFTPEAFKASPDGSGDNSAALQAAIDQLEKEQNHGIIFIPEGRYRFTQTVQLWRGIRLIGFGQKRPVFFLDDNAPGFNGPESRYMFHFRVYKPKEGQELRDAQNTTFYSGIRNIDFDMGKGNTGAVAARFRVAQLCSLEDIDFHINDSKAAIEMIGNEVERCRFFGGQYGILTGETVAYWQFYLGDSIFDGQKRACISTYRAGFTMVRTTLRNAPFGIYVPNKEEDNHYIEEFERLYIADCRMENLSKAGISMNMVRYPQNWLHGRSVYCKNVPCFLDSFGYQYNHHIMVEPICPESDIYSVDIDMGLKIQIDNARVDRKFDINYKVEAASTFPAVPEPDYVMMPAQEKWVNILDLGAKGDGIADDTAAIKNAIVDHKAIYFPMGHYRISDTLTLAEDTCIIGLHCFKTQFVVSDNAAGFNNAQSPKSMLIAPKQGHNHVCGVGFDGGQNPGLTSLEWLAAPDSLLEDILFLHGGHGKTRKGRDRYYTMWIHDGGAGVFKNIWTPDVWAKDGLHINDTEAPGQIYLISVEHHLDIECVFERVANWKIISLQTEENLGSEYASSVYLKDCFDMEFQNLFQYRVQAIDIPHPYASHAVNCKNLVVNGVHVFSIGPTPFTTSWRVDDDVYIHDHEIGSLIINC